MKTLRLGLGLGLGLRLRGSSRAEAHPGFILLLLILILIAPRQAGAQVVQVKPPDLNKDSVVATNKMVATTNTAVLYSVVALNSSGGDLWLLVFDRSTNNIPPDGTVPIGVPIPVPAGKVAYWDPPAGRNFRNGIIVANSTTDRALTNSSANFWISVSYNGKPN